MIDKYVLYVDNFRGFQNTYIPLADVSFLVGENSSGKTSILKLLKLMSQRNLLVQGLFTSDDFSLTTADDLITARSGGSFRIGMIRRLGDGKTYMPLGMVVAYESRDGIPIDIAFTCTLGASEFAIRRVGTEIYTRVRKGVIKSDTDMLKLFSVWIRDQKRNSTAGFIRLELPRELKKVTLLQVLAQIGTASNSEFAGGRIDPTVVPPLTWLAPIRTKPRKTYDEPRYAFSSEGGHTPYLLQQALSGDRRFMRSIQKIGEASGLFKTLRTRNFGKGQGDPFQVRIVLDKGSFNVTNVGYGVSQALPVIVELLKTPPGSWISIQQPEVHLHPRAQAALGDLIFDLARSEKKIFLIETHSDYMIDRYRVQLRKSTTKPSSQVLFFERRNGKNSVTVLPINENGELPADQPKSYRRFFIKEQMEMLEL